MFSFQFKCLLPFYMQIRIHYHMCVEDQNETIMSHVTTLVTHWQQEKVIMLLIMHNCNKTGNKYTFGVSRIVKYWHVVDYVQLQ